MPKRNCTVFLLLLVILPSSLLAKAQPDFAVSATSVKPAPADPAIAHALAAIEPTRIDQTVKSLVSFGTRSSLSSGLADLPSGQGVEAAADWIFAQFQEISRECGGCLEVGSGPLELPDSQAGHLCGRPQRARFSMGQSGS